MKNEYEQLTQLLISQGFQRDNDNFKIPLIISTPDQLVVINGVSRVERGKMGKIDILLEIQRDVGEIIDDEISREMLGVFLKAQFKGVTFKQDHFMYDDIGDIIYDINKFLRVFDMRI